MPGLLSTIRSPQDLRALPADQLPALAAEIRTFLIEQVSQTGGHLGPNLGVVELTIAAHRAFESPRDPILFDTGHQAYVHKILTGRQGRFPTLRQRGGLSGYPNRAESEHDWIENSHASTGLSYADGLAKALRQQGRPGTVLAFVGDGSLTGGMAWEALNNIAAADDLPLVILVNDNGRSYTPTVGGLARQLSGLRTNPRYEQVLDLVKRNVSRAPLVGNAAYDVLHGIKIGLKDLLAPQGMFSDLGLKYVGPIDGHDVAEVERALLHAKQFGGPVLVHCLTRKGNGFSAAEAHEEDRFHAVGKIDSTTGESLAGPSALKWTDVFSEELLRLGSADERVVGITAAMTYPTGLHRFARAFPNRVFDVGIAEQHAVTSAAGLAMGGLHPVVAVYATFLNRAFDQLLMDVALHRCGVTFALDRAGITGPDGASHHGMWDMSILQLVPGLHLSAPRDATRLRQALATSLAIDDAPSVIRYSNQRVPDEIPAEASLAGMDVVLQTENPQVLVVGFGEMVSTAISVGQRLADQGIGVTVLDPVWALPVNPELIRMAADHDLVISIEDNGIVGGCGARLAQEMRLAEVLTPIREFGIEQRFIEHGSRENCWRSFGSRHNTSRGMPWNRWSEKAMPGRAPARPTHPRRPLRPGTPTSHLPKTVSVRLGVPVRQPRVGHSRTLGTTTSCSPSAKGCGGLRWEAGHAGREEAAAKHPLGISLAVEVRRDATEVERPAAAQDEAKIDVHRCGHNTLGQHEADFLCQRRQCTVTYLLGCTCPVSDAKHGRGLVGDIGLALRRPVIQARPSGRDQPHKVLGDPEPIAQGSVQGAGDV